ncbi:uncharacterized protein LOC116652527 [Coturnix japonica]|uniref:uncharacterized protein LOC116652527 n=1 Tax=Coturnix japonica TaxID=93934 RepID=UPI0013A5D9FB|nr:uncharacterized protein LOC116652527 [Coturnix japonica]
MATPSPGFWDAAWRDLAKLVEQGSLSCCSSNAQPENQRGASAPESGDNRQMYGPKCCCHSCNRCCRAEQELQQLVQSALREHIGTLGTDHWDAAWSDLTEVVESGSLSCCYSQGVQSSTRRSNRAHTYCRTQPHYRPGLMATKPAQTKFQGGRAASRAGDPTKVCWPQAEQCIVCESIVLPDRRLPQRPDNLKPLLEWAVSPPGLRTIKKEFPGRTPSKRCRGSPSSVSDTEQHLRV